MKNLKLLSIILLPLSYLLLFSCAPECSKKTNFGTLFWQDSSFQFGVYEKSEKLVFKNNSGDIKTFNVDEFIDSVYFMKTASRYCEGNGYVDEHYVEDGYSAQFKAVKLKSGDDEINYTLIIFNRLNLYGSGEYEIDTVLYDLFNLTGVLSNQKVSELKVITSYRNNENRINYDEQYFHHADTTILDRTFTNVYQSPDNQFSFLFTPGIGVIALIENGVPWLIEE